MERSSGSYFITYNNFGVSEMLKFLKTFNPLILTPRLRSYIDFDPSRVGFNEWMRLVDEVKSTITMGSSDSDDLTNETKEHTMLGHTTPST